MLYPVILCGGSGTRLWPVSRNLHPKQFIEISKNESLFSKTLKRVLALKQDIKNFGQIIVICNENHRFLVASVLHELEIDAQILLEPCGKNTAPAIALAAFSALEQDLEAQLLVLPSDHLLEPQNIFNQAVLASLELENHLVTFGIKPQSPETGFGYIQVGQAISSSGFQVQQFVEKPKLEKAKAMLESKNYYWNSGMFAFQAKTYLEELEKYAEPIYKTCLEAYVNKENNYDFIRFVKDKFLAIPAESIDYAVMEHTKKAAVIPLEVNWSDLGNWEAFKELTPKDEKGNHYQGDVLLENTKNCFVYSTSRLVTTLGLEDITIIESDDAILVAKQSEIQDTKKIVEKLKAQNRSECENHTLVHRPWGYYQSIGLGERFQVKRIVVKPKAELSLQLHHHRAEHWVIVRGTGKITIGENEILLHEDQSVYIPLGTVHRLANPGHIPLEIVEVQTGSYLGEDDIVRLDDQYQRNV